MAKRHFLSFFVAVMLSFTAFSQTPTRPQGSGTQQSPYLISTVSEFLWITNDNDAYYRQTADIDLGNRGPSAIISSFSGTYDGNGCNITYGAEFDGQGDDKTYALFGTVTGTIKKLNLDANVTMSASGSDMRCGLLCGYLKDQGTIEYCNVTGNINSTANAGFMGSSGTGMIAGRCDGTIQYCTASGNVSAPGYVGGIAGQLGGLTISGHSGNGHIKGCSFNGDVTATYGGFLESITGAGSFAGGICGFATSISTVELCCVNADVNSSSIVTGAGGTNEKITFWIGKGKPTITNNYCEGTVNGEPIDAGSDITNSGASGLTNYYEGQDLPDNIKNALNGANSDSNINFEVINGEVVLVIGQQETVLICEAPSGLRITENEGLHTADWTMSGTDNSIIETTFHYTLTNNGDTIQSEPTTETSVSITSALQPSPTPYVFTVKADCHTNQADLYSDEISQSFMVECPKPTNLSVSEVSYSGFSVNYSATAKSKLTVASTETEIENTGNLTQQITELLPQTEYTATVSVLCDEEYVESLSTTVTTSAVPAPTNLSAVAVWQGDAGMVTISWTEESGLTYEIDGEGVQESDFEKSGLDVGNYTARVRARYQNPNNSEDFYYSDWSEIAYTVSNPPAPSNPQISFAHQGNGTANVTITWEAGSNVSPTWTIEEGETSLATGLSSATYTISGRNVGSSFTIGISETTIAGESRPLLVNVTVPCADATLPESIETNQTTATFTFASEQTNRKIVIGSTEHDASSASVTLSNLSSGTNYNYTIREYCTATLYSEKSSTFVTKSCYAVTGLQAQATGVTSGSASWTTQSDLSGLNYKVRLLQGANEISSTEQPETSITFSGLQPSTTYTVEVSEQCGETYGDVRTINFTTESSTFITKQSGNFNDPNTWTNGKVPQGDVAYITIAQGHIVTLTGDLTITPTYKIASNQGVLVIPAGKQLINTTDENIGGIIEVSTPQKTMNQWTFIGAPFENYKLETIKPIAGSDISISEFNYGKGNWSDEWALYDEEVGTGEGYFAWPFYTGAVTYTTYGDLWQWNQDGIDGTIVSYDFNKPAQYKLNNEDEINVEETLTTYSGGNWMALANPYPFKLKVATFLSHQTDDVQGDCIYKFNGSNWVTTETEINVTEGFFVNYQSSGPKTATFKKIQRNPLSKKSTAKREFVKLALIDGKKEVDLLFAHNQEAEQNYDIFDANKMFSPVEIAEPYFVTEGIALVKEEVKELPYYATMNVRSYKDDTVSFVVKNIPKDMSVFIIDNEEEIKMSEDVAYTTHISEGENADRFQVLFKKASVIEEAKDSEITITNTNRLVRVESTQTDLRIEVYNALGQKVFATNDYNFTLNEVSAGTYMIKAYNRITTQTAKIVVE